MDGYSIDISNTTRSLLKDEYWKESEFHFSRPDPLKKKLHKDPEILKALGLP